MRHLLIPVVLIGAAGFSANGCCSRRAAEPPPAPRAAPPPAPFLGVPEDRARKVEDENPEIDSRTRGVTTTTAVEPADYATYLRLKQEGKVTSEEFRDGFVYFATQDVMHAPLPPVEGVPGAASGAYFSVTNRFKAPLPKEK